jgi:membrane-associated phospholipid phosphatase
LHAIWVFITDCGDSAVTIPLALLTLIFLLMAGARRLALFWLLTIGGCAGAIALLKLAFGACGQRIAIAHIVSPSGHTAMSAAVYGSLALLVGTALPPRYRRLLFFAAAIAVVGIALSRVVLHQHNAAEIVLGLIVGGTAVAVFRTLLSHEEAPALPFGWLVLSIVALIAVMHGARWMVEPAMQVLARTLRLAEPWCR